MEIVIIIIGSVVVPVIIIIGMVLFRKKFQEARKESEQLRKVDAELIDTLEQIVAIKSDQIQRLQQ